MAPTIGFRIGDQLQARLERHLDEVEEATGYRPNKSDVVRDALAEKLGVQDESSGLEPEETGASA